MRPPRSLVQMAIVFLGNGCGFFPQDVIYFYQITRRWTSQRREARPAMELIQKQTHQMDQRLIQRLEVLQMSAAELRDYLQELSQENPVVDLNEPDAPTDPELADRQLQRLRWLADTDHQNQYYQALGEYENDPIARIGVGGGLEETLPQFIDRQLDRLPLDGGTVRAVRFLASCLDWDGYLRLPLDELARSSGMPSELLEHGLKVLRTLEPAGIGAESLSQCLELQLQRAGVEGPALAIVRDHLESLARCRYRAIADCLKVPLEEVLLAQKAIRDLDPRPGAVFERQEQTPYVYPDVFVEEQDGHFVVRVGRGERPAFQINGYYRELLANSRQPEVREYLHKKVQAAQDILQAISQREDTLRRCAQVIVDQQEAFFRMGEQALRPLRMADVADMVGVHESTVSRAVREKYLQCHWGVYPLSWFFSRKAAGEDVGGAAARVMLRELIDGEDKRRPLSDQKLCEEMARLGCPISRRTVAKYRDELNIPGTSGRRDRG